MHVLDEPVREVGQRVPFQLVGEEVPNVRVAGENVRHGLSRIGIRQLFTFVEPLHAGRTLGHVQIERPRTILLREDQFRELSLLFAILELMVQEDQQQGKRRESLLTVDDELLTVLVADDDGTEKVVAVFGDGTPVVALLMTLEELVGEIVQKLGDLFLLPLVLTLVVINRVLAAGQEFSYGSAFAVDLAGDRGASSAHENISPLSTILDARFSLDLRFRCLVAVAAERASSFARSLFNSSSRASTSSRTSSDQW